MIAIAVTNNDVKPVLDFRQFLEMVEKDYQLDIQDVVSLINDGIKNYTQYPEIESVCDTVENEYLTNIDGISGDNFYIASEELENSCQEIEEEIKALRSTSRKGNTKEDIARRLEIIVSNLRNIL